LKERKPEINTKSNEVHRKDLKLLSRTKLGAMMPTLWRPRRAASCSASLLRRKRPDSTEVPSGRRKVHANMGVVCSPGSTWSNPSAPTLTPGCRNNSPGFPDVIAGAVSCCNGALKQSTLWSKNRRNLKKKKKKKKKTTLVTVRRRRKGGPRKKLEQSLRIINSALTVRAHILISCVVVVMSGISSSLYWRYWNPSLVPQQKFSFSKRKSWRSQQCSRSLSCQ
jgi:hypothetical protein